MHKVFFKKPILNIKKMNLFNEKTLVMDKCKSHNFLVTKLTYQGRPRLSFLNSHFRFSLLAKRCTGDKVAELKNMVTDQNVERSVYVFELQAKFFFHSFWATTIQPF